MHKHRGHGISKSTYDSFLSKSLIIDNVYAGIRPDGFSRSLPVSKHDVNIFVVTYVVVVCWGNSLII